MSRSNIDKPFYVDVGTSIAAVRCQSNMDVLDRFDHVRMGKAGIEMAEKMCDRMNAEVEKFVAAKDAEIANLRALVKELADALDNYPCHNCKHGSERCEWCGTVKELDALVARAREVVK